MFIYIDAAMVVSWIRTWFFGSVKFDFFKSQPDTAESENRFL